MSRGQESSEIIEAFRVFDRRGNGTIALSDFIRILKELGDPLTQRELDEVIAEARPRKSGEINYVNFVQRVERNYCQP
jgi:calmodulin